MESPKSEIEGSSAYTELVKSANNLQTELRGQRTQIGKRYQTLLKHRRTWQSIVVVATSTSTGFAGYVAQQGIGLGWRLLLVIVVALTGAVAAIRDAWQVNELLDDARDRYLEIKRVSADLAKALYDAEGSVRLEDRLSRLGPSVRNAQARLSDLSDDLVELPKAQNP